MKRYENKVAIVTGSASGIGQAIVRRLIAEGALVLATDINRRGGADSLAAELGERCIPLTVDVSKEADVANMVEVAQSRFGRVHAAFNVAGSAKIGTIVGSSSEDWQFGIDLCVMGTFYCMKYVAQHMIASGVRGAIVNVGSLNSDVPAWGMSSYSVAKAAVEMLGKSGSIELAEHGIRVNTVSPGLTNTPPNAVMPDVMRSGFLDRIPMKRAADPDEQAEACLFLGSDAASYITGANLVVDGGWANSGYPDTRPWFGAYLEPAKA